MRDITDTNGLRPMGQVTFALNGSADEKQLHEDLESVYDIFDGSDEEFRVLYPALSELLILLEMRREDYT